MRQAEAAGDSRTTFNLKQSLVENVKKLGVLDF